jgi:hypothetical protein
MPPPHPNISVLAADIAVNNIVEQYDFRIVPSLRLLQEFRIIVLAMGRMTTPDSRTDQRQQIASLLDSVRQHFEIRREQKYLPAHRRRNCRLRSF